MMKCMIHSVALVEGEPQDADPWDLPELKDTGVPWTGEVHGYYEDKCCLIRVLYKEAWLS